MVAVSDNRGSFLSGRGPTPKRTSRSYLQMKLKYFTPFAAIALVAPALAGQPTILKDQRDKASYSIGVNIGSGMKANSLDLNTEALMAGLQETAAQR
jgi:hypothetical protein